jgi:hypothetical protein
VGSEPVDPKLVLNGVMGKSTDGTISSVTGTADVLKSQSADMDILSNKLKGLLTSSGSGNVNKSLEALISSSK